MGFGRRSPWIEMGCDCIGDMLYKVSDFTRPKGWYCTRNEIYSDIIIVEYKISTNVVRDMGEAFSVSNQSDGDAFPRERRTEHSQTHAHTHSHSLLSTVVYGLVFCGLLAFSASVLYF